MSKSREILRDTLRPALKVCVFALGVKISFLGGGKFPKDPFCPVREPNGLSKRTLCVLYTITSFNFPRLGL